MQKPYAQEIIQCKQENEGEKHKTVTKRIK